MNNRNWLTSNARQRQLFGNLRRSSQHRARLRLGWLLCAGMLMALALLLSACTTPPTPPCEVQKPPTPPALSQPMPSESYSVSAARAIEAWRKLLMGTPAMSKP